MSAQKMGTRLTYTAAPSAEIRARQAAVRAPRPVTVRHDDAIANWWWTPAHAGTLCDECNERVPKGSALAYRHADQRKTCEICADRLGLGPKPSKAWEHASRSVRNA